ncbi:MAG: DUF1572 family protein [Thermoanaerobaculia bacterium]
MSASAYDLVVIGSGPAGQKGAIAAAKLGKKVAVIDRKTIVGGVCLHTGTIPSKTLREAILYLTGFRERSFYGQDYAVNREITVPDLAFRVHKVMEREPVEDRGMEAGERVPAHRRILGRGRSYDVRMPETPMGALFLEDALLQFHKYKALADGALAQVAEGDLFRTIDSESNSIALVMKHLAGNMRSRWTDFLTTDGEKADRDRDAEFELGTEDTRVRILDRWEAGWRLLFDALAPLTPADLLRTVTIRAEAHTVLQAVNRQLTHYAYHVGQIVFLARHFAGSRWRSLSIPRGKSKEFDVSKEGKPYVLR